MNINKGFQYEIQVREYIINSLNKQAFLCANSWGTKWALQGYCYMPYKYLLNRAICSDFCITEFKY